ncbi:DUF2807 domain-containing protein [Echinicola marina]|uniref:GIN domain-containing protein n=1 Tax=Echinicola marina TaxID=2859768 RepID=UPI001CF711AB|nr:DUF2807 domain-containing protein [Echinicola marina]UCS95267.1 DUF2807 domain-containing protein [Echinicola marina]
MKMNIIYLLLLTLVSFSCENDHLCIKGDGRVRTYELDLGAFDQVSLVGPIDLVIIQDEQASLKVMAEAQLMDVLDYRLSQNELRIGLEGNVRCLETNKGIVVVATLPNIRKVNSDGLSTVRSEGSLDLEELVINSYGEFHLELSGEIDRQVLYGEGNVEVNNFGLLTNETVIEIAGRGDYEVFCTEELSIDVEGAARVDYKGNPMISQHVEGLLDLNDAN